MGPPVLLITLFRRIGTLWFFFTVADGLQLVGGNSELYQEIPRRGRAPIAQPEVVLGRAALVTMAFHHNCDVRIVLEDTFQKVRIPGQRIASIRADIALVIIEVGVLSLLRQQLAAAKRRLAIL